MTEPASEGALALSHAAALTPIVWPGPSRDDALRRRAERFVRALVEVIETDRPVTQLVRWTTPRVYAELNRRLTFVFRAHRRHPAQRVRPRVESVRVFQPCLDVAEVSARIDHGERSTALALRLESTESGWRCTAISWC